MYFVVQTYDDKGKVTAVMTKNPDFNGFQQINKTLWIKEDSLFDCYIDAFETKREAEKFRKDALMA